MLLVSGAGEAFGVGAMGERSAAAAVPGLDLGSFDLVDLTHPFDERTVYWPTSPSRFALEPLAHGRTEGGYFYAANRFCAPEHGGTHLDAPLHFAESGWAAEAIPLERLIAPAVVIDVTARAAADRDYRLTAADVIAWEAQHGTVPEGVIVLLRTGWSASWPEASRYLGSAVAGDASDLHFPSYGEEAARLLVEQRRVAGLGVDTASIDHGQSRDFLVHRLAAAANVFGLENLAHLEQLPPTGSALLALPMKIAGGSGGPLRAVALVPRVAD